jgi:hypothetical protein
MTEPASDILRPLSAALQHEPEDVIGYVCPVCRLFYSNASFGGAADAAIDAAIRCCQRTCMKCEARLPKDWHYIYCQAHLDESRAEKQRERIDKATKIPELEYDGPVYCEDNEEYYATVADLRDAFDGEGLPSEVWACTTMPVKLDADHILDGAFDDHHEDARSELPAGAEANLQTMLDAWVAAFAKDIVSWDPDYSRFIVLAPDPEPAAAS